MAITRLFEAGTETASRLTKLDKPPCARFASQDFELTTVPSEASVPTEVVTYRPDFTPRCLLCPHRLDKPQPVESHLHRACVRERQC